MTRETVKPVATPISVAGTKELLDLLGGKDIPTPAQFKDLVLRLRNHTILAKVFLLDGVPFVFRDSPMKYIVFKEHVADRFGIGSQDVCIVGSAKLGFSPSPHGSKFGRSFSEESDVDVVIISDHLFDQGSRELFQELNVLDPPLFALRDKPDTDASGATVRAWKQVKEAIRNYVFQNFNPGNLSDDNPLKKRIFEKISSTDSIFLALDPKVFVSKIRCRVFRNWRAAEDYYANSLREAKNAFRGKTVDILDLDESSDESLDSASEQHVATLQEEQA